MSELLEAIEDLKVSSTALRRQCETEAQRKPPALTRLAAALEGLGQGRPARPIVCPEEHLRAWQTYRTGNRKPLHPRAIRYLCWEPDVVLDPEFHYCFDEQRFTMGAHGIQGLVRACHLRWHSFLTNDIIQRIAKRRLGSYRGPNRIVSQWQRHPEMILAPSAAQDLAQGMLRDLRSPHEAAAEWGIDETTTFFAEAISNTMNLARRGWGKDRSVTAYICCALLPWSGWSLAQFKGQVTECILDPNAQVPGVREPLKVFVLGEPRLGDPRLPTRRKNWLGVSADASRRLIEWLSRDDIVFFFDHAFPKGGDPHRRKPFWLRYVPRVAMSRPLLNQVDFFRLRTVLRQLDTTVGNFGRVVGLSSAFLLHFGEVCVIEFNRIGACYVYPRAVLERVVPDFWTSDAFFETDIKRRDLLPDPSRYRIIHRRGWEDELQQLLASYGVRPTS